MLFPIIKVKDGDYTHIVGTNSHDVLYIDEKTGGIQYLNLQGMEGTEKHDGEESMSFVPKKREEWETYPEIEFVTIEELIKIAEKNMVEQTEASLSFHAALDKYLEAKGICDKKREADNVSDTSGMLF